MMALAPPPPPDPSQIETRLHVVAEMLDRAVADVQRALAAIKGEVTSLEDPDYLTTQTPPPPPGGTDD